MSRVLVTDGNQRAALAVVRSLGRAGHEVVVGSAHARPLAAASKYATAVFTTPDALAAPDAFCCSIRAAVEQHRIDVLLPVAEPSVLALLQCEDDLPAMPMSGLEQFRRIADKNEVVRIAAGLGIAVPGQCVLVDRNALAKHDVALPAVLKPSRSVGEADGRRTRNQVSYAHTRAELKQRLDNYPNAAFPILVQQRVRGPGVGVSLLRWDGVCKAAFVHQRLREKPPSGGVSVYRESIAPNAQLIEQSLRLLAAFEWQGVAMVEYKIDDATGTPFVMEINPRFWGSLQLAIDAGVDFPALLVASATGQNPPSVMDYRVGVRSRWWWGEVDHLITRLRRDRTHLNLLDDAPGRRAAVMAFFRRDKRDHNEIWQNDDPGPFVRETVNWLLQQGE